MPRFNALARRRTMIASGALAAALAAALSLAGCADTQPGDVNNGPGYTDNITDLSTKVQVYSLDPCRSAQSSQLFANCGRFVTQVASTIGTLRSQLPGNADIGAAQNAVNGFQRLGCDAITGTPTAAQRAGCPQSLVAIGHALDDLNRALAKVAPTTPG